MIVAWQDGSSDHEMDCSEEECLNLLSSLNGTDFTSLVVMDPNGVRQLSVGGNAKSDELIVSRTEDSWEFYELVSKMNRPSQVRVIAGGQPADFDGAIVATLQEARQAVCEFYAGSASSSLTWRMTS